MDIDDTDDQSVIYPYDGLQTIVIEEVSMDNINENELSEFESVSTIPIEDTEINLNEKRASVIQSVPATNRVKREIPQEQEEILIKQLIDGELSFSEYDTQIGHIIDVDLDSSDDNDSDDEESPKTNDNAEVYTSADMQMPSTSQLVNCKFQTELVQSRRDSLRGKLNGRSSAKDGRQIRRTCTLPPALQGLMGEANLCYARGQTSLAEKVCLEIIRQVPLAHEPFLTLAQIYESNPEKYMQFSLIAAHLNPGDIEQWIRIAQLSVEQGNIKQAINCYMKAIKRNANNVDLRVRRIELLQLIGEEKMAYRCYLGLLAVLTLEKGGFLYETAKMVAEYYMKKENNPSRALEAMSRAYNVVPNLFKTEDLNMYLELLITANEWKNALDVLSMYTGFEYRLKSNSVEVIDCVLPSDMILDFRSKAIVCLVHMHAYHLIDYLLANIFQYICVEDAGDCYLDVAEALMKCTQYANALSLLVPLIRSKNFNLAAVWLRHADCHRALGNINDAIDSYKQVVAFAPQHFDARLTLSALLKQQGRHNEALAALDQNLENDLIDPCVLYERCYMLKETGNLEQYIDVAFLLLRRHSLTLRTRDEKLIAVSILKVQNKIALIKTHRKNNEEPIEDFDGPEFSKSDKDPSVETEWALCWDIVRLACEQKRFDLMQKILFSQLTNRRFMAHEKTLTFWSMLASIYQRDNSLAYVLAKEYIVKYRNYPRVWNLFNIVLQFTDDTRYSKFLLRFFRRSQPNDIMPAIIRSNYFLSSGSYKYAINDYAFIYKKTKAPLVALLIGVTYAHMALQKFMDKRHNLIAQAIAFATKYKESREDEARHEVHYNLGRFYHQFGINNMAVFHYKEVLQYDNELIRDNADLLDLKRQAAYNLHLIYKTSGNIMLARKCLLDHVVI